MADNNNILNQPFGLNIKVPTRTIQQGQDTINHALGGVFEPLFNFISENQNVFTGQVFEQIEKYNLMSYNTGAILRKAGEQHKFDIKG